MVALTSDATVVTRLTGPTCDSSSALNYLVAWDPGFAPFADPPPAGHEYVVGSHKVTLGNQFQHIRVSAHSLPGGVNPKGTVEITFTTATGTVQLIGDVDCLNVGPGIGRPNPPDQNEADVDAILRQPYQGNTHVRLIFIDNGDPGPLMGMSPDLAFWEPLNFNPPPNCSNGGGTLLGDRSGNIVIQDRRVKPLQGTSLPGPGWWRRSDYRARSAVTTSGNEF